MHWRQHQAAWVRGIVPCADCAGLMPLTDRQFEMLDNLERDAGNHSSLGVAISNMAGIYQS